MIPHLGAIVFTLFLAKSMRVNFKTIESKEDLDTKKIIFDCAPNERFEEEPKNRRLRRDFDWRFDQKKIIQLLNRNFSVDYSSVNLDRDNINTCS